MKRPYKYLPSLTTLKDPQNLSLLLLGAVLITSFTVRVINLNYNSAFNDEAVYIVVGRLGLFQGDWVSYNPSAWVAGHPFFYPSLTAIANSLGGLISSRLLNVVLGILLIEVTFTLAIQLFPFESKLKYLSGAIAAALIGGSATGYYVSRLATYDMPSFYLMFLSLTLLLLAQKQSLNTSKFYFFSALTLYLSFLFKITSGIYLPFIAIYALVISKKLGSQNYSFFKKYYLIPLTLGFFGFILTNLTGLQSFYQMQSHRENYSASEILGLFWNNSSLISGFFLLGTVGMLINRQFKKWLLLFGGSALIVVFHIATKRLDTFDKHILISLVFASIIAGIGIPLLISQFQNQLLRVILITLFISTIPFYWYTSILDSNRFNSLWNDSRVISKYLANNVKFGDKLLAEVGAAAILDTYEKNTPANTTTFDFFQYGQLGDEQAYVKAVQDGYFNFIQLDSVETSKEELTGNLSNLIRENLNQNYELSFQRNGFQIFKRRF